jgi:hypothetical protein
MSTCSLDSLRSQSKTEVARAIIQPLFSLGIREVLKKAVEISQANDIVNLIWLLRLQNEYWSIYFSDPNNDRHPDPFSTGSPSELRRTSLMKAPFTVAGADFGLVLARDPLSTVKCHHSDTLLLLLPFR